ncbi:hypothetical protein [Ottowia sp.]|jgi:hypothetical protein|uniref:hypothetical protein n=1 Tax=Ottowia sp. TaxID=1898956 RepID=UPI0025E6334E|nr:hypothetical protein [Ottowia sp.]MBK6614109.1 hypothetical protein [Ottowia sp.]
MAAAIVFLACFGPNQSPALLGAATYTGDSDECILVFRQTEFAPESTSPDAEFMRFVMGELRALQDVLIGQITADCSWALG